MEIRKQIEEYIRANRFEIVSRTCDLVKIPSICTEDDSGRPYGRACAKALDYLYELCGEKHLIARNLDYRCLEVKCREQQSGKRLVIATHADVVPTEDENLYDPFGGRVYGDYIIGRGVVDDKGPLMASLYALAFFREYDIPLKNDIRLYFGSNEECGMDDLAYYLSREGMPDWGLSVDDDFPTVNGEKGVVRFTLSAAAARRVTGVCSYGSRQRTIHDFCEMELDGVRTVLERSSEINNPVLHQLTHAGGPLLADEEADRLLQTLLLDTEGTALGIGAEDAVSGKTRVTLIEARTRDGKLEITFDARIPVSVSVEQTARQLRAFARSHPFCVEIGKLSKGYYHSPDQPVVRLLTDTYNREAGTEKRPYVMSACTYARMFDNGCGFGCGSPDEIKPFPQGHGGCHGPDEAHNIEVLLDAVKYLILGIKAIDDHWSEE